MKTSSNQKLAFALLVPFLALLAWVMKLEQSIIEGRQVRIRVEGYDPRDLLAGHYIRFRIGLSGALLPADLQSSSEACLCLEEKPGEIFATPIRVEQCEALATCPLYLRGSYNYGTFLAGIERYSISERHAPVLAVAPAESNILVAVTEDGKGVVMKYFVGEEPLEEYAERKLGEGSRKE